MIWFKPALVLGSSDWMTREANYRLVSCPLVFVLFGGRITQGRENEQSLKVSNRPLRPAIYFVFFGI